MIPRNIANNTGALNLSNAWNLERILGVGLSIIFSTLFLNSFLVKMELSDLQFYGTIIISLALLFFVEKATGENFIKFLKSSLYAIIDEDMKKAWFSLFATIFFVSILFTIDWFGINQTKEMVKDKIVH